MYLGGYTQSRWRAGGASTPVCQTQFSSPPGQRNPYYRTVAGRAVQLLRQYSSPRRARTLLLRLQHTPPSSPLLPSPLSLIPPSLPPLALFLPSLPSLPRFLAPFPQRSLALHVRALAAGARTD